MTSRQRVINAIEHKPTDRIPIDLGMHFSTGISAFAYWNLREYLGMGTENIEIVDPVQFLARVDNDILERFHCDAILLHPGFTGTHRWKPRGKYEFIIPDTMQPELDNEGNWIVRRNEQRMRMPAGGFFFDGSWPSFTDSDYFKRVIREAERIYKETDYFTAFMEIGAFFSESVDFLCNMLTDPDIIIEGNKRHLDNSIEYAGKIINSMGEYIQGITLNSDLGMQSGPFCNPAVYEDLCAPFLKKLCSFIHENSDFKIFMHSCGSIKPLIPILIDCGVDAINPVQISANNMDPGELKREFGDRITFWGGGCNTQQVLNIGSPEDVAANVKKLVKIFKPGGGFVFNQVHNIMGDIKPENIVSMLGTAYEESFGSYICSSEGDRHNEG
jgi:uroporphyrinogen decarboxylase